MNYSITSSNRDQNKLIDLSYHLKKMKDEEFKQLSDLEVSPRNENNTNGDKSPSGSNASRRASLSRQFIRKSPWEDDGNKVIIRFF